MATITKKNLVLTFGLQSGKETSITITAPKEGLTAGEISGAMTSIVNTGAYGDEDLATSKVEAKYVIQQEEQIVL